MLSSSVLLRLLLCVALQAMYASAQLAFTDKDDITTAIRFYIEDEAEAIIVYGLMGDWDTANVDNFADLFSKDSIEIDDANWDISAWDTSSVTSMREMFKGQVFYNQPLDSWDTSSVTTMEKLFL